MYYNFCLLFFYFFLYAVIGWCCEVVFCSIPKKKFINRGFLNGPYCPIYGVGAMIIVALLGPYLKNPLSVFFVAIISTSILEYITSWAMEKLFHAKWWDYSNNAFNLNGRICLRNSILFGIMGLALMYLVHPFVDNIVIHFSKLGLMVVSTAMMVLIVADLVSSTLETLHLKNKLSRVSELATALTKDLKDQGIATKAQLAQTFQDARTASVHPFKTIKSELEQHLESFEERISEKVALRRYSHSRIINAFPNMVTKDDPDAASLYREALLHAKKMRKNHKKVEKQTQKSQEN